MGRKESKKRARLGVASAKERHKKGRKSNGKDWKAPLPMGLVARPDRPRVSSKHKSWFEFVENKDKKKKLEIQIVESREPPPGYEFVPIGNPALTALCKEISRERGAMIFIVSSSAGVFSQRLSLHLNRVGHHIRQTIVEEARKSIGDNKLIGDAALLGLPEPIPERQEDINAQADAAIRDLFPRIPHTDRQMIIEHAFNKSKVTNPDSPPVGLAKHISLSRRVQLAVLAHIRHTHTRYDQLLKETTYVNARKAVETLCLDFLVKWRGDEETGRDQLDEILCEVIVISDSENSDSESDDDEDESDDDSDEYTEDEDSSGISSEENALGDVRRADVPTRPQLLDRPRLEEELRNGTVRAGALEGSLLPSSPRGSGITRDGIAGRTGALSRPMLPSVAQSSHPLDTNHHRGDESPRVVQHRVRKSDRRDREKKEAKWGKRGFSRYQAVWEQAVERQRLEQNRSTRAPTAPVPTGRPASHGPQPWLPGHPEQPEYGKAVMSGSPREAPHHTRHQAFGTSLHQVTDLAEARNRHAFSDNQHRNPPVSAYYPPPSTHGNGAGPIVGSQLHRVIEREWPAHHAPRSEDQPLQSIETASPSGYPVWRPPAEPDVVSGTDTRRVAYRAVVPLDKAREFQDYHTSGNNEGFIQLPPRSDQRRMSMAPNSHAGPYSPTYSPSGYNGGQERRELAAPPRTELQPIWVDDDGHVLRSAAHPIYIQDSDPVNRQSSRQQRTPQGHLQDPIHLPIRTSRRIQEADPSHGEVYESGYDNRSNGHVMDSLPNGVQILRVANKFPKQYGSIPLPADQRTQLSYNSGPVHDVHDLHDVQSRYRRTEQDVAGYEQPAFLPANGVTDHRGSEGHRAQPQRTERVVGYEFVHTTPGRESVSYTDRQGQPIKMENYPAYRASVPHGAHSGYENQPIYHRRFDGRGNEIIILDD
ncbi:hypothetical protein QBC43DRAFT_80821 [Cladorrhinum sp. PSN259]|nr:hypothetical protein QBC43DRAFT_80821 [Cladorrhinum sp. PSN259]